MQLLRCRPILTAVILSLFLSAPGSARAVPSSDFAGVDDRWKIHRSPHFELFSHWGEQSSRELLQRLELLRTVFFDTNRLAEREPLEVTVFAFSDRREFEAYCTPKMKRVSGYYLARPDRAVIALAQTENRDWDQRVIFHEYVHHLIKVSGQNPPLWLNEGMAEMFSTIEVKSKSLVFGRPVANAVAHLQQSSPMPLAALFASEQANVFTPSEEHAGLFYSQSWALLHYWYFGDTKVPLERIRGFVQRLMERPDAVPAADLPRAFREATGEDYAATERKLGDYVRYGRYAARTMPLPQIPGPETYSSASLAAKEIRERLAELSLRSLRDPRAKFVLLTALDGPNRIRALETLGTEEYADGNPAVALARWDEALAAGSTNPAVFHVVGQLDGWRWFAQFDYYFRLPPERAERLRRLLLRSIEVAPQQSDAYELLAWVESAAPEPSIRHVNLVQRKFSTLRNKARTLVALALVRVRMNDLEAARAMLEDVAQFSPEPAAVRSVEFIRKRLDTDETASPTTGEIEAKGER